MNQLIEDSKLIQTMLSDSLEDSLVENPEESEEL